MKKPKQIPRNMLDMKRLDISDILVGFKRKFRGPTKCLDTNKKLNIRL